MHWEDLVSSGHVRAAKLRSIQSRWIIFALILTLAGLVLLLWIAEPRERRVADATAGQSERAEHDALQGRALARHFDTLTLPPLDEAARQGLAPAYEMERVLSLMVESLNETGGLPASLPFQRYNRDAFWSDDWNAQELRVLRDGSSLYLVGAIVSEEYQIRPQRQIGAPLWWFGVLRRSDSEWQGYTLTFQGSVMRLEGSESLRPADYPETLARLVRASDLSRHREAIEAQSGGNR